MNSSSDHDRERIEQAYTKIIMARIINNGIDAIPLAGAFYEMDLIALTVRNDILYTDGLENTKKLHKILNPAQAKLKISQNPKQVLNKICQALKRDPALTELIAIVEDKLGMAIINKCIQST